MTKSVKRHLNKRTGKHHSSRENALAGVHGGRPPTGVVQAKARSSIADKKVVRIAGILFLPIVFGIFGLIMFPPSFDVDKGVSSNASLVNKSTNNKTMSPVAVDQSISNQSRQSQTASEAIGPERAKQSQMKDNSAASKREEETTDTRQKKHSPSSKSPKSKEKKKEVDFSPVILDSLNIQEIEVDGRIVQPVELTKDHPESPIKVYMFEGFLTEKECAGLKRVHLHHIQDTGVKDPIVCFDSIDTLRRHIADAGQDFEVSMSDFTEGTMCINATFSSRLKSLLTWSYSTAFYPGESKFSNKFEDRVFAATGLKKSNGGKFQITSYPEGIGYKTHTDCTLGDTEKRDRFGTILVYLQDVAEGGETRFPELGISVKPKKGRAIVWNNMNNSGDCEPTSIHEAAKVIAGHKYIIQRWYYYQNFPQLGKRSREPPLPERVSGQPRVNCDEYEHGSCRWYDEWNYEHLLDYRAVQRGLS